MYKNNKPRLENAERTTLWIKRKIMLCISAFIIGMSNGMNIGDETALRKQHHTEQQNKKE